MCKTEAISDVAKPTPTMTIIETTEIPRNEAEVNAEKKRILCFGIEFLIIHLIGFRDYKDNRRERSPEMLMPYPIQRERDYTAVI